MSCAKFINTSAGLLFFSTVSYITALSSGYSIASISAKYVLSNRSFFLVAADLFAFSCLFLAACYSLGSSLSSRKLPLFLMANCSFRCCSEVIASFIVSYSFIYVLDSALQGICALEFPFGINRLESLRKCILSLLKYERYSSPLTTLATEPWKAFCSFWMRMRFLNFSMIIDNYILFTNGH